MLEKFIQFVRENYPSFVIKKGCVSYTLNLQYKGKQFKKELVQWARQFTKEEKLELIRTLSLQHKRQYKAIFRIFEITDAINKALSFSCKNGLEKVDFPIFTYQYIQGPTGNMACSFLDISFCEDFELDEEANTFLTKDEQKEVFEEMNRLQENILSIWRRLRNETYSVNYYHSLDNLDKTIFEAENGYDIICNGIGDTQYSFFLNMADY